MRILMVTQQAHDNPREGGTLRTSAVESQLVDRLGQVDVVSWLGDEHQEPRAQGPLGPSLVAFLRVWLEACRIGAYVCFRRVSWRMVREIVGLARLHPYDLVVIEYSTMVMYRPILRAPAVVDLHNVESHLLRQIARSRLSGAVSVGAVFRSLQERWDARAIGRAERNLGRWTTHACVVSVDDRDLLRSMVDAAKGAHVEIVVAPNGFQAQASAGLRERPATVVFVATLGWEPNIEAACWLVQEVWPQVIAQRPHARLQLVGRRPAERVYRLAAASVEIHADVPDVVPYVAGAAVATAPLLTSGGTRLKILEALGAGTPVVATTAGALGLHELAGSAMTVVDAPDDFADAIVKYLDSRATCDRDDVRQVVSAYSWPQALAPLVETCQAATEMSGMDEPDAGSLGVSETSLTRPSGLE